MATLPPSPGRPAPTHTQTHYLRSTWRKTHRQKALCVCVYWLLPQCPAAFPRIHSILCPVGRVAGLGRTPGFHRMNHTRGLQEVWTLLLFWRSLVEVMFIVFSTFLCLFCGTWTSIHHRPAHYNMLKHTTSPQQMHSFLLFEQHLIKTTVTCCFRNYRVFLKNETVSSAWVA